MVSITIGPAHLARRNDFLLLSCPIFLRSRQPAGVPPGLGSPRA